jgi:hypothetical protein
MKIDHYGQMLIGCIDCNRWGHPGDTKPLMELLPEDLEALRAMRGSALPTHLATGHGYHRYHHR